MRPITRSGKIKPGQNLTKDEFYGSGVLLLPPVYQYRGSAMFIDVLTKEAKIGGVGKENCGEGRYRRGLYLVQVFGVLTALMLQLCIRGKCNTSAVHFEPLIRDATNDLQLKCDQVILVQITVAPAMVNGLSGCQPQPNLRLPQKWFNNYGTSLALQPLA
jgi:hypothetical protein